MKLFFKLLFFCLIYINVNAQTLIKMGMVSNALIIENKDVSKISARLWEKFVTQKNPDIKLSITFYEDKKSLIKDFVDKKIIAFLSNDRFYFKNKDIINQYSNEKYTFSRSKEKFEKLYLLKNTDSDFNLQNFNTKEVLYIDSYAKVWFDTILKEQKFDLKGRYKRVNKVKKLLYDPFFKKDKVSIVAKSIYDTMVELNPQIILKTEIVKTSPKIFFLGMGFLRKDISTKSSKIVKDIVLGINSSTKDLSDNPYISINSVNRIEDEELEQLRLFYKEFL